MIMFAALSGTLYCQYITRPVLDGCPFLGGLALALFW
jgi:hypothetical protein